MSNRFWLVCWSSSLLLLLARCGYASANNIGSGTPPGGSVSILTDRSVYQPTDRIQATVRNMLSIPIYALDSKAECSILSLEVQIHDRWQASSIAGCLSARAVRQIRIDAGAIYTVSIHAGTPGVYSAPLPVGTYRLVLHYWTDASRSGSVPHTMIAAFSPTFSVR